MHDVAVIVPTLNAGDQWRDWLEAFARQRAKPAYRLIIDSGSRDDTVALARQYGFDVEIIAPEAFNHGGTRQRGVARLPQAAIVVFLTQDAILAGPDELARLVACFADAAVGAAYGRQLPQPNAGPIGAHARLFNYPPTSAVRTLRDRQRLGIKAAFLSNSFSAFRRSALLAVGGFPSSTIMNEDTYVAAKLLLAGWNIAYCSEAAVYHSHDYRLTEECRRYFDIGVFHAREPWIRQAFGAPEGEAKRFVLSELAYLTRHAPAALPGALVRTLAKWWAFRVGCCEHLLPYSLKRVLSLHRRYWKPAHAVARYG